jgi:hypothetical protein
VDDFRGSWKCRQALSGVMVNPLPAKRGDQGPHPVRRNTPNRSIAATVPQRYALGRNASRNAQSSDAQIVPPSMDSRISRVVICASVTC